MNSDSFPATASLFIHASQQAVWKALTDPRQVKQYMFGSEVESDWKVGSPVSWRGSFKGKLYEDKGIILENNGQSRLCYSHYSALSGKEDRPENYHTVCIDLRSADGGTKVTLVQDGNESEEARQHSQKNWEAMLQELRKLLEEK